MRPFLALCMIALLSGCTSPRMNIGRIPLLSVEKSEAAVEQPTWVVVTRAGWQTDVVVKLVRRSDDMVIRHFGPFQDDGHVPDLGFDPDRPSRIDDAREERLTLGWLPPGEYRVELWYRGKMAQTEDVSLTSLPLAEKANRLGRLLGPTTGRQPGVATPPLQALRSTSGPGTGPDRAQIDASGADAIRQWRDTTGEITNWLRNSPTMVARYGTITRVTPAGKSWGHSANGQHEGRYRCQVEGDKASEIIGVYWEKHTATGPIQITRVDDHTGKQIPM